MACLFMNYDLLQKNVLSCFLILKIQVLIKVEKSWDVIMFHNIYIIEVSLNVLRCFVYYSLVFMYKNKLVTYIVQNTKLMIMKTLTHCLSIRLFFQIRNFWINIKNIRKNVFSIFICPIINLYIHADKLDVKWKQISSLVSTGFANIKSHVYYMNSQLNVVEL